MQVITGKRKKAVVQFFCPLCGVKRRMTCRLGLSGKNYGGIALSSVILILLLYYPLMKIHSFFVFFIIFFVIWAMVELAKRLRFKRDIPCPHCGFDASWYKRDIKVARRLVKEFWDGRLDKAKVAKSS